jgi:hypothetical protein
MQPTIEGLPRNAIEVLPSRLHGTVMGEKYKLVRVGVDGEGSCFFHSVCYLTNSEYCNWSLKQQKDCGEDLRKTIAAELSGESGELKWTEFSKTPIAQRLMKRDSKARSLKNVIGWFKKPSVWANEIMIAYVSWKMDIDIVFIDAVNTRVYCDTLPENQGARNTIIVMWVEQEHFEPVAVLKDHSGDHVKLLTVLKDPDMIAEVRKTYKEQCPKAKLRG